MDIPTIPGAVYSISSASSCDVTDKASGQLLGTATSGSPFTTPAYSDALTLSDPDALYVQLKNFNYALAALGLLGGGVSALPPGYIAAEFLKNSSLQKIRTYLQGTNIDEIYVIMGDESSQGGAVFSALTTVSSGFQLCIVNKTVRFDFGGWSGATTVPFSQLKNKVSLTYSTQAYSVNDAQGTAIKLKDFTFQSEQLWFSTFGNYAYTGKMYYAEIKKGGKTTLKFTPGLDNSGAPCMFDAVSGNTFYNSGTGAFIVGFTLNQARKLSSLPVTGGALTISLPTGYNSDAGVVSALETARSNGWTLTIQTYTPENATASSSTFALRRIWVRRTQDENGTYVAASGTRWQVEWCVDMLTPDGSTPDAFGYELFRSVDAAVAYWELAPWVDPEAEQMMQNELLTNSTTK